jgi:hypothetical protein
MKPLTSLTAPILACAGLFAASGSAAAADSPAPPAVFSHRIVDPAGPLSIWGKCAADLNGDGRVDLLVGGWLGGGLVWYENPGWTKHPVDPASKISTDIEVADVDRDGKPDIIAVTGTGVVWYRGPDWKPHPVATDKVHDIEVADFDGDGKVDIVARNQNLSRNSSGATLFVYRQASPQEWVRSTLPILDGEGLKAADLDRDGDLDLVLNGTWLENRGGKLDEWPDHVFGAAWKHDKVFVATGDLNGDGRLDIVLSPSEPKGQRYRFSWFEAPAELKTGAWVEHVIEADIETVHHFVGVADFNRDGRPDVATAAMRQGAPPQQVSIYLNTGKSAGWTRQVIGTTGNHSMRIVDLDGSGRPSLFGANHQENKVELWRNDTK